MNDQKVIVFVLFDDGRQVVLIRERRTPGSPALLNYVKGTHDVDRDASLEATAWRELREEIGVEESDVARLEQLEIERGSYPDPPPLRYHFFRAILKLDYDEISAQPAPEDDESIEEVLSLSGEDLSELHPEQFLVPVVHEVYLTQVLGKGKSS